jgi:hypothetical protein
MPMPCEIEVDEGFRLEDLMQEFGRWELQALGDGRHGHMLPAEEG